MKNTMKLSLCAMVTALSTVTMLLTFFPYATYALPGIAGVFMMVLVIEINRKWALGAYFAASFLSFFLSPDREAALMFFLFMGYYPIVKACLERLRSKALEYSLKLLIFNAAAILETWIAIVFLHVPIEPIPFLGKYTVIILLVLGNITFFLYDKALSGLAMQYMNRIHPFIKKIFK